MTLGFDVQGNGASGVVVLHEWLADHRVWDLVRAYLPGEQATFVFADLRGYGRSRRLHGEYTLQEAVSDVLSLMHGMRFERFSIIGHSMSGMIAQWVAATVPERIEKLMLVSPVPAAGLRVEQQVIATMEGVIENDDSARQAIIARTGYRYNKEWVEFKLGLARSSATKEAQLGYLKMITNREAASALTKCQTPTFCVLGRHDIAAYQESSLQPLISDAFENSEFAICEEAGHYAMLEAPPLLAATINSWLSRP